jgi:hypothetical protein
MGAGAVVGLPPLPPGFVLDTAKAGRRKTRPADPVKLLRDEGFVFTNGFRTPADVERIRAQGYSPAEDGAHNRGDGVDLDHPRLTRAEQKERLEKLFGDWEGARVLDEGHHRHLQLPGWRAAPGTPGTPNSGLPPIPAGFELHQRGSLQGGNFQAADTPASAPSASAPLGDAPAPGGAGDGYRTNVDPAKLAQLQSALDNGQSYSQIRARARSIGVAEDATFLSDLQNAVRWRDTNKSRGARFVPGDARPIPEPTPPEEGPGLPNRLAAAANRGLADVLGAPVDLVNAGMGAVGIPVSDRPFLGSEQIQDTFELTGYLAGEGRPYDYDHPLLAPQSTAERYGQRAIEFTAGNAIPTLGLIGKGSQIIGRGASALQGGNALTQAGRELAVQVARRPGVAIAGDVGASVGAAVGGEGARDIAPDSAGGELAGQLIGGLAGGLTVGGAAASAGRRGRAAPREPLPELPEGFQLAEGPHGPIHRDLAGDYPAALARLRADQAGEVPGAIRHPELGDVDLVWGDGNYGLSKIVARHPEVVDDLPAIVERLPVRQRPEDTGNNRFVLEDDTHRAVVAPDFNGVEQRWLVTAFERKGAPGNLTSRRDPLSPDGGSTGGGAADDILPNASQRNAQADVGQLWRLSRDDLESLAAEKGASDQDKLLQALGSPEAVKRFNALDRMRNSSDPQRSDEGSRLFDDEFGNLTPEQERLVYGIGETDASLDDIRALISAHSDVMSGDDVDWSSYMAAVAARRVQPEEFAKVLRGEGSITAQAAFVRMGAAYENMRASGVPTGDIPRRMVAALVDRGGWNADDAAEVIGSFVRGVEGLGAGGSGAVDSPRLASGQSASMASDIDVPTLTAPSARAVDRIDVNDLPPLPPGFVLEEPALGKVRPSGDRLPPEEIARLARSVDPEDVTPGPTSRPLTQEDVEAAHDASWRDIPAPAVGRRSRKPSSVIDYVKGWVRDETSAKGMPVRIDAEDAINHGVPAEYIYLNPTVADRSKLRLRNPSIFGTRYGAMSGTQQHLRSLDQLNLDPAAWGADEAVEAGRLEPEQIGDLLRRGLEGDESAINRADPAYEPWRDYQGRAASRAEFEGRFPDAPPVERLGETITLDDLRANDPPAMAYEDMPRLVGRVGNINLEGIESPQDVARLIKQVQTKVGGFDEAKRGVVTNEETRALAAELGLRPEDLLKRRRGQALNAEELYATRVLVHKSREVVGRLAKQAVGGSDEQVAAFRNAWMRHVALEEQVTAATAEVGRAMQSFKMLARAGDARGEAVKAYLRGGGGRETVEDAAKALVDLMEDPAAANRFLRDGAKVRKRDMINELWINSLLSGPRTHVVNFVSNGLVSLYTLPEQAFTAGIGKVLQTTDRATIKGVGRRAFGMIQGAREGLALAKRALITGEPGDAVSKVEATTYHAIPGKLGSVIRTPTRMLTASDELWKGIARGAQTHQGAYDRAMRGSGSVEDKLQRYRDLVLNPDAKLIEAADDAARYYTFQRPLGEGGRGIQQFVNNVPLAKFIVPFVRTPINILKFATERSVFAPGLKEVREAIKAGGNSRNEVIARMTMGSGLSAWAVMAALDGKISAGPPSDSREAAALRNSGWQPYSIRIGDRWVSYQRFEPISLLAGVAADFAEVGNYATSKEAGDVALGLSLAIAKNLTSKTWLSGLSDFMEAISDPERYGERWVQRMAGTAAVPAIAAHAAGSIDPYLRETRNIVDGIKNRIPILSQTLPVRRNVWGDPVKRGDALGPDYISPVYASREERSPLLREVARLQAPLSMPSRSIRSDGVKHRLTAEQYDHYVQLTGKPARQYLENFIKTPEWRELDDDGRREMLRETLEEFRSAARNELRERYPELTGEPELPPLAPGFIRPRVPPGFQLAR